MLIYMRQIYNFFFTSKDPKNNITEDAMKNAPRSLRPQRENLFYYSGKVLEKYFVSISYWNRYKILFFQPELFPHFPGIKNLRSQGSAPNKWQIHIISYKDHTPTELMKDYRQRTAYYRRMKNEEWKMKNEHIEHSRNWDFTVDVTCLQSNINLPKNLFMEQIVQNIYKSPSCFLKLVY